MVSLEERPVNALQSALTLRIVQPGFPERTETLQQAKYTVGSSERCQIHLPSTQVKPLHCLIVQNESEAIVTRWAAGVLLNGQEFTSSPLAPGDCLSFGEVEINVHADSEQPLPDSSPIAVPDVQISREEKPEQISEFGQKDTTAEQTRLVPEHAASSKAGDSSTPLDASKAVGLSKSPESSEELDRIKEANRRSRSRCRSLIQSLRQLKAQASTMEGRVDELRSKCEASGLEREHLQSELKQIQERLSAEKQNSSTEMDRLIGELNNAFEKAEHAEQTVAQQSATLDALQSQLASLQQQCEELESVRAAGELQRNKLAQAVADRDRQLETLQDEFNRIRSEESTSVDKLRTATDRIETLAAELERLKAERDELAETRSNYQLREMEWEQAVSERELALEGIQKEKNSLLQQIEAGASEIATRANDLTALKAELEAVRREKEDLESVRNLQNTTIQELEKEVSLRDERLTEKENECESLTEFLQSFEQGAFEQTEEKNRLATELEGVKAECEGLQRTSSEQLEGLRSLEAEVSERNEQISLLNSELSTTLEKQKSLELRATESVDQCEKLSADLDQLRIYYQQLSAERDVLLQEKEDLHAAQLEKQTDLETLKTQLDEANKKCVELKEVLLSEATSNERLQVELAQMKDQYEVLESQTSEEISLRQDAQQKLVQGKQQSELFVADLQSVKAELKRVEQERNQLQIELAEAQEQIATLSYELEANVNLGESEPTEESKSEFAPMEDNGASETAPEAYRDEVEFAGEAEFAGTEFAGEVEPEGEAISMPAPSELESSPQAQDSLEGEPQQTIEAPNTDSLELVSELEQASEIEEVPEIGEVLEAEEEAEKRRAEPESSLEPSDVLESELHEATSLEEPLSQDLRNSPAPDYFAAPQRTEEENFEPTSYIEQYQKLMHETEGTAVPQSESVSPGPIPTPAIDSIPVDGGEDTEDVALEAYMANLMKRMRGESNKEVPTPVSTEKASGQDADPLATVDRMVHQVAGNKEESQAVESPSESKPSKPLNLESLRTASAKPELPTDLNALRELANTSARKAIARHHKRRHFEKTVGSLVVCVVAIGIGLYTMLTSQTMLTLQFFGGALAAIVGAFGGGKLLRLVVEAIRERAWEVDTPDEIPLDTGPLPIDGVESLHFEGSPQ